MAGRKVIGSSSLLEFLVALIIGGLAVLGALLCIGFLLVEPIRSPPSEAPTIDLGKGSLVHLWSTFILSIHFIYPLRSNLFSTSVLQIVVGFC